MTGLGKLTAPLRSLKFSSNFSRFLASTLRSSCWFIILPNSSTSSGNESHSIPGNELIAHAKKAMILRSRRMVECTRGWRTLMATAEVGAVEAAGGDWSGKGSRAVVRVVLGEGGGVCFLGW